MEEKVIPLSKGRNVVLTCGALGFVLLDLILLTAGEGTAAMTAFAYGSMLFFGFCALTGIRKLIDPAPGLVLNREGFIDNSSGLSAGRIPWSDVEQIKEFQMQHQRFISVILVHPQRCAETGNALVKWIKRANLKMSGTPVNISANSLKIRHEELLAAFDMFFKNSRASGGR